MTRQDQIKAKCIETAAAAQVMATRLLMAASPQADDAQMIAALSLAYRVWPMLCRRSAELEELAPKSAEAGFEHDESLMRSIRIREENLA